ncbi:MAG: hypothetical protein Q7S35_07135 [Candidatus Limnocylindrales bacterium]|nr:hypothetical protein [Candidatus Limnocylindrales bacterium]
MDRSVAQGGPPDPRTTPWPDPRTARWLAIGAGLLLALLALAIFTVTRVDRYYDHFVWQAAAFLEGHAAIRYPVEGVVGVSGNSYFQDVLPIATDDGVPRGLLPFPPLPAIVLLPFVALWGLATDDQAIFTILAAADVAVCWWALGRLAVRPAIRVGGTIFLAVGTVFWFTAQVSTTWYQAHIVAVGLTLLAVGIAVGGDPGADGQPFAGGGSRDVGRPLPEARRLLAVDRRQFLAGLLFGLACTARLTVLFGAPFFALVGSAGDWRRRSWSAGLGAALPLVAVVFYNVVTTGHVFHPAYDYLYVLESNGYPTFGYHPEWAVEDPRYIPQNLGIALFGLPDLLPSALPDSLAIHPTLVCTEPGAGRGLFDAGCPLGVPRDTGMSVILTSPGYLLAIPVLRGYARSRLVTGAALAIVGISVVNLMHFSQGWVQFGYRFSNDAAPFALLLVAIGTERLARRHSWGLPLAAALLVLSIAINLWGVLWSRLLGW